MTNHEAVVEHAAELERLSALISSRTGLNLRREQDVWNLENAVKARLKPSRTHDMETYHRLLDGDGDENRREWSELLHLLLVGESYFFRDSGQFHLLRHVIFPELIRSQSQARTLRVWSAGCHTGEEAYSLAILLDQIFPFRDGWEIFILGTDINAKALEHARQGCYSKWSFRNMTPEIKARAFRDSGDRWRLVEEIRKQVTFRTLNIADDVYPTPDGDLRDFHLIMCRNVFLYFDRPAVSRSLGKMIASLAIGGYLVTGHSELFDQNLEGLQEKVFPESIIYQRCDTSQGAKKKDGSPHPACPPKRNVPEVFSYPFRMLDQWEFPLNAAPVQKQCEVFPLTDSPKMAPSGDLDVHPLLAEAEDLFRKSLYLQAIECGRKALKDGYVAFDLFLLLARAFANCGDHAGAVEFCQKAIDVDPFSIQSYYLLAHIAKEQGNAESAKNLLRKILNLAPECVAAYLELGKLYDRDGNVDRTQRIRQQALSILEKMPADARIEFHEDRTVKELMADIRRQVGS